MGIQILALVFGACASHGSRGNVQSRLWQGHALDERHSNQVSASNPLESFTKVLLTCCHPAAGFTGGGLTAKRCFRDERSRPSLATVMSGTAPEFLARLKRANPETLKITSYWGEIKQMITDTFEPDEDGLYGREYEGLDDGAEEEGDRARFTRSSPQVQRIFKGEIKTSPRSDIPGTKLLLREFWAGEDEEGVKQCLEVVEREVNALTALYKTVDESNVLDQPLFTYLMGDATQAVNDIAAQRGPARSRSIVVTDQVKEQMWMDTLRTEPPRTGSIWLVYPWDGTWTLERFSVPTPLRVSEQIRTKGRGVAKFVMVDFTKTSNFVVRGIIPQLLKAIQKVHDVGYAHRSLDPNNILLGAIEPGQDTGTRVCDPAFLVIKLQDFRQSTPLIDDSPERIKMARKWETGDTNSLDLAALSIAEDLYSAGLCILRVLLGSLATPASESSAGPGANLSPQRIEQLIEDVFKGDIRQLRSYVGMQKDWARLSALLDLKKMRKVGNERIEQDGWDFLETLLTAREAARERKAKGEMAVLTAGQMLEHAWLATSWNDLSKLSQLGQPPKWR